MNSDIKTILLTREQLAKRVKELAQKISEDYRNKDCVLVSVLKGSFIFYADLVREIDFHTTINFLRVSSYGSGATSSAKITFKYPLDSKVEGKHVLVIEDIIDSGNTYVFLKKYFKDQGALSVSMCALLDKPERREVDISAEYVGFEIPNEFVVGYGLDYDEKYRNLPYIGVLKPEIYKK
ncbi:MAG: hypoxanthine phosphoribosyltransferase [Monoglobales bacterium]